MKYLKFVGLFVSMAAVLAVFSAPRSADAQCSFDISGNVDVEVGLPQLLYAGGSKELQPSPIGVQPLRGANVRVRTRLNGAKVVWSPATEFFLDDDGFYHVRLDRKLFCNWDREYQVQVRFKNDRLGIFRQRVVGPEWWTVARGTVSRGSNAYTDSVFNRDTDQQLDHPDAREQAQLWFLYDEMLDLFDAYGPDYTLPNRLKVQYPYQGLGTSFADPDLKVVHLKRATFDVDTALHEAMHIWAYHNSRGEGTLTLDLISSWDTHDWEADTGVGFHEGFADFASMELQEILFGWEGDMPRARKYFDPAEGNFTCASNNDEAFCSPPQNIDELQHWDDGWTNIFTLLTQEQIWRLHFNDTSTWAVEWCPSPDIGTGCMPNPSLSFKQLLGVFLSQGGQGEMEWWELNWDDFANRIRTRHPGFDQQDVDVIESLCRPHTALPEPEAAYCFTPQNVCMSPQLGGTVHLPDDGSKEKKQPPEWYVKEEGRL